MSNLLRGLEALRITGGDLSDENLWTGCTELLQKTFVPQKLIGNERPCVEKDFREYRQIIDRNLRNLLSALHHIVRALDGRDDARIDLGDGAVECFATNVILIVGEQSEKNVWNTAESVSIANEMKSCICKMFGCESLSQFLTGNNRDSAFDRALITLRPKLLKDCWKSYPAAVACYKWLLFQIEEPGLSERMTNVLPTALIILDDFVPDNRVLAIECLHRIVKHAYLRGELVDTGYAEVIFGALEPLMSQREAKYVMSLYSCIANLLATLEFHNDTTNSLEWTKRDDVLATLLGSMEFESNSELRHCYMSSLPQLLTSIGCAKWCERLTRILSEYCEHHTDVRTLIATIEAGKAFLLTFHPRVPAHCTTLYTAFLKLHLDLTETPVFDKEILQNLEDCICLLYKLTPTVAMKIIQDDRMRSVIKNNLQFERLGDITYFE